MELSKQKELKELIRGESLYIIKEIIGTSKKSWEDAARQAIEAAEGTLEDLRIGEVVKQDVTVENGKVKNYRVKLNISFKYNPWWDSLF
jgi:hypothetical protein